MSKTSTNSLINTDDPRPLQERMLNPYDNPKTEKQFKKFLDHLLNYPRTGKNAQPTPIEWLWIAENLRTSPKNQTPYQLAENELFMSALADLAKKQRQEQVEAAKKLAKQKEQEKQAKADQRRELNERLNAYCQKIIDDYKKQE
jgi:hypothetical protein